MTDPSPAATNYHPFTPDESGQYCQCGSKADAPIHVVTPSPDPTPSPTPLTALAKEMRANSERWFPFMHSPAKTVPLHVFYAMGMSGEAGEALDEVKKTCRTEEGMTLPLHRKIAAEMADAFTYMVLLADELNIDLIAEYRAKVKVNEGRWGNAE